MENLSKKEAEFPEMGFERSEKRVKGSNEDANAEQVKISGGICY
ncbi:hypothetical protein ACS5NO_09860 [Larkinella sp. GY13]